MNVDVATLDTKSLDSLYHGRRKIAEHGRFPAQHHSRPPWSMPSPRAISCRCCCSAVLFGFALHALRRARQAGVRLHRQVSHVLFGIVGIIMKLAPIGAFGAMAFTIGKYGLGIAGLAGQADGQLLPDLPALHLRRARADRAIARLQHLQVHPLHQGRTADRARHLVFGIGAAAHDGQAGEPGLLRSRSSAWSSRPAIRSTWTAPRST